MDTSNWRPTQGPSGAVGDSMESGDWRAQLQADSRQRIVNKIMDTLKRHLPFSGHEGLQELKKISVRFEEKIYTAATNESDYLRKISLKMLTKETSFQNPMPDAMQANSAANSINPSDPGSQVMPQVNNQGQQLPIPVPSNHAQPGQQMMSQSMHSNLSSTGIQGSSGLSTALTSGNGFPQSTMANVTGQNSNLQNIQNMSGLQQGSVGNAMGPNSFASQRQIPGRQQLTPQQQQQQQQQQQSQNSQYLYQQQLRQKLQQTNITTPPMQSHIQQQQQNLLQPNHLQSSQQSIMQAPSLSTGVQTQQPVAPQSSQGLMTHQQSVMRQQRQQLQPNQQQQTQPNPMGQQQANATNMQQTPLIGQQNSYSDVQQQQQQRLIGQQNKLSSVQQPQQHMVGQHNNLSSMQPQQLGSQSNASASLDSTAQTGNPNGGDWQEEVYQKIKAMKDLYLLDLNDMHQKILGKLQQHDSLPQQPKNEQIEKLRVFKIMLERFMQFLQIPKHGILANYNHKLGTYEKQIVNVINSNRRKPAPTQQQQQALPPQHMHSMQQSQQPLSQLTQVQSHDNQMNLQGSMASMQQNNMGSLQQNYVPSMSGGSNAQQNMMNSLQPSSNLDPGQNSSMNSLQLVSGGSLQQNTVSGPQQGNINPMSLKQQEQLLQSQQLKQFQLCQMQQQFMHKQLMQQQQQQFHQQTKQQSGQLQGNQLAQLQQINYGGDITPRQQMSVDIGHQQTSAAVLPTQSLAIGTPGISASPLLAENTNPDGNHGAVPSIGSGKGKLYVVFPLLCGLIYLLFYACVC